MAQTYSYNFACAKIEMLFGKGVELKHSGNRVHTGFYHCGRLVAEYNENTGHLTIHEPQAKGMRTIQNPFDYEYACRIEDEILKQFEDAAN